MKKRTGLVLDDLFLRHRTGAGHPETPGRLEGVAAHFTEEGLVGQLAMLPLGSATDEDLARVHTADYLALVKREVAEGRRELSTGDTVVCPDSELVARTAAGSLTGAVDAVMAGTVDNAFCAVRPPGHHATAARGMGFCVYNSVAVAARYAQAKHGIERVVIIDWDVHHGNGTQDIFYEDGSVYYFSTHQSPWYPGTGAADETGRGDGQGTTLNVPVAAGGGMREIGAAFRDRFVPAMEEFRPGLVLVSAGFDSRHGDPLGGLTLSDENFVELTRILLGVADAYADGHLVSVLEGGYNIGGLAQAAAAHVRALGEG